MPRRSKLPFTLAWYTVRTVASHSQHCQTVCIVIQKPFGLIRLKKLLKGSTLTVSINLIYVKKYRFSFFQIKSVWKALDTHSMKILAKCRSPLESNQHKIKRWKLQTRFSRSICLGVGFLIHPFICSFLNEGGYVFWTVLSLVVLIFVLLGLFMKSATSLTTPSTG